MNTAGMTVLNTGGGQRQFRIEFSSSLRKGSAPQESASSSENQGQSQQQSGSTTTVSRTKLARHAEPRRRFSFARILASLVDLAAGRHHTTTIRPPE